MAITITITIFNFNLNFDLEFVLYSYSRGSSERIWVTGEPQSQSQPKFGPPKDKETGGGGDVALYHYYATMASE